jgi:NitT/TauT family transport system substrate-binding protein
MHKSINIGRVAVSFMLICWTSLAAAQPTKLAVGYSGISADQLVIWVAKDIGIFAKNNIDAQTIYFSGGTLSVTAMISGDTPVIQASGPGIVSAGLAGADPIYVVGLIVSLDDWLMTQPEIKTAEQLKGGTIAVARFGGAADFVARYALARLGLNPGKDVTIVQTGSTPERMAAMERGVFQVARWFRLRPSLPRRKVFTCWRTWPLWAWPISIKEGLRPGSICGSTPMWCETL